MTIIHKPFYFLRHGQTDWNKQLIVMGQTDIHLNEEGIQQAHTAAEFLQTIAITSIAVSPLSRALKTAHIVNQKASAQLIILDDLKECLLGIREGKHREDASWLAKWIEGHPIEDAESFLSFSQRVATGVNAALELPGPVLIVAHGGVYRAIQKILNIQPTGLPNCALFYHEPPKHPHLEWSINSLISE